MTFLTHLHSLIKRSPRNLLLYSLTGVFLFTLFSCSGSKKMVSPQVEKSITIDGDLSDWPHSEALLKESNFFNYYAVHDSSNLYVYANLKSSQYKNIIENAGFTIYLSGEKKNKKALGITYPVGAYNFLKRQMPGTFQQMKQNKDWIKKSSNQQLLKDLRKDNYKKAMITQRAKKDDAPQQVIVDLARLEAQGIKIARDQLHGRLQLELSIPINMTKTQQFAVSPGKNRTLELGFAVDPPDMNQNDASTTVDLSQQYPYRGPYGRYKDNQEMDQRLSQLTDSQDSWFTIKLGGKAQ